MGHAFDDDEGFNISKMDPGTMTGPGGKKNVLSHLNLLILVLFISSFIIGAGIKYILDLRQDLGQLKSENNSISISLKMETLQVEKLHIQLNALTNTYANLVIKNDVLEKTSRDKIATRDRRIADLKRKNTRLRYAIAHTRLALKKERTQGAAVAKEAKGYSQKLRAIESMLDVFERVNNINDELTGTAPATLSSLGITGMVAIATANDEIQLYFSYNPHVFDHTNAAALLQLKKLLGVSPTNDLEFEDTLNRGTLSVPRTFELPTGKNDSAPSGPAATRSGSSLARSP